MRESFEKRETQPSRVELLRKPALESFLDLEVAKQVWDKPIVENEGFVNEVRARQELNKNLEVVLAAVPEVDRSLSEAVAQGEVTEEQVARLYESLSPLLEGDSDYQRLALYLPFEFLPEVEWKPGTPELKQASERFKQAFLSAWERLLSVHDVRANFVDGDVLEVESRTGDLPRVVKAAHLIPKLVEKGLLEIKEVLDLFEDTEDEVLKESLQEALPVLVDLNLLEAAELAELGVTLPPEHELVPDPSLKLNSAKSVKTYLGKRFRAINKLQFPDVTKKRAEWLKQEARRKAGLEVSQAFQASLTNESLDPAVSSELLSLQADPTSQQVFIDGLRLAIESLAKSAPDQAQAMLDKHKHELVTLWNDETSKSKDALAKLFYHLHGLRLLSDQELASLGLERPKLAGPLSENLLAMKAELAEVKKIAEQIENDPELSGFIHPVVLVFGSRLKGYGSQTADIDLAVFVKPGTDPKDKEALRAALGRVMAHEKIGGQAVEFWLEEKDGVIAIQDFDDYDPITGERSWTHILFGAAWEGKPQAVKELRNQVLAPYLEAVDEEIYGRQARGLYLEELERDSLQYRLMHKGYEKFFPPAPGLNVPHGRVVDAKSSFWDSGYRRTATKLFANRVFIPQVSK